MPEPIRDPYARELAGEPTRPAETSGTAVASVVAALICPAVGGLFGLALGVTARGEILRSEGRYRGVWLANTGIIIGAINLIGSVVGFAALVAVLARPSPPSPPSPPPSPPGPIVSPAPTSVVPGPSPTGTPRSTTPTPGRMSVDDGVIVTEVGNVTLVDIGPAVRSLEAELDSQRDSAKAKGEQVVVWLVWPNCEPCNGVAASLPDARMQKALGSIRLVRIDVTEFSRDLKRLGIPTTPVPGFALLGARNRPVDFVHGGEWDADIAVNIAPVLEQFVRGKYDKRRHPWRGGQRDDETPI